MNFFNFYKLCWYRGRVSVQLVLTKPGELQFTLLLLGKLQIIVLYILDRLRKIQDEKDEEEETIIAIH